VFRLCGISGLYANAFPYGGRWAFYAKPLSPASRSPPPFPFDNTSLTSICFTDYECARLCYNFFLCYNFPPCPPDFNNGFSFPVEQTPLFFLVPPPSFLISHFTGLAPRPGIKVDRMPVVLPWSKLAFHSPWSVQFPPPPSFFAPQTGLSNIFLSPAGFHIFKTVLFSLPLAGRPLHFDKHTWGLQHQQLPAKEPGDSRFAPCFGCFFFSRTGLGSRTSCRFPPTTPDLQQSSPCPASSCLWNYPSSLNVSLPTVGWFIFVFFSLLSTPPPIPPSALSKVFGETILWFSLCHRELDISSPRLTCTPPSRYTGLCLAGGAFYLQPPSRCEWVFFFFPPFLSVPVCAPGDKRASPGKPFHFMMFKTLTAPRISPPFPHVAFFPPPRVPRIGKTDTHIPLDPPFLCVESFPRTISPRPPQIFPNPGRGFLPPASVWPPFPIQPCQKLIFGAPPTFFHFPYQDSAHRRISSQFTPCPPPASPSDGNPLSFLFSVTTPNQAPFLFFKMLTFIPVCTIPLPL